MKNQNVCIQLIKEERNSYGDIYRLFEISAEDNGKFTPLKYVEFSHQEGFHESFESDYDKVDKIADKYLEVCCG